MIEQKVIIDLKNDMGGVGTLYISALNPKSTNYSKHSINDYLILENIDLVEIPDKEENYFQKSNLMHIEIIPLP